MNSPPLLLASRLAARLAVALVGVHSVGAQPLPTPTGRHAVGSALEHWTGPEDRFLPVRLWYPADGEAAPAPYVFRMDALAEVLPDAYRARAREITTAATLAPPAEAPPEGWPVAVLSHGLDSMPAHYATLAQELASHGWAVVAVGHPDGARALVNVDGTPLRYTGGGTGHGPSQERVEAWSREERAVIDEVRRAARGEAATTRLNGRLDGDRIVTLGHALGGASALLTAQEDPRVRATVLLDASVRDLHLRRPLPVPSLVLTADPALFRRAAAAQSLGTDDAGLERLLNRLDIVRDSVRRSAPVCVPWIQITGVHQDPFSDIPVVFGEPADLVPHGLLDARRALALIAEHVRTFLDQTLGRAGPGLSALAETYPEAVRLDGCPSDAASESRVRVGDAALAVRRFGPTEGIPLVVVHGGPSLGHRYLLPWVLGLAGERPVILYDQRGMGHSTVGTDSTRLTMRTLAEDLEGLREALGIDRMDLLAHSFGASVVTRYASEHAERVGKVVLVSPAIPGPDAAGDRDRVLAARSTEPDQETRGRLFASDGFREGRRTALNRVYEYVYRPWFADPVSAVYLHAGVTGAEADAGRWAAALIAGQSPEEDWTDRLDSLAVPVLVLHGALDPIPTERVREIARRAGVTFEAIPEAGHFPFIEAPAQFTRVVEAFLQ